MTAVMLTVLPLFTFSLLFVLSPGFFLDVANDPWFVPGFIILFAMYLTGFLTIRKMVDLKVSRGARPDCRKSSSSPALAGAPFRVGRSCRLFRRAGNQRKA